MSIRNIPFIEDASSNIIIKNSITDLADLLNIEASNLERFIFLIISVKSDKIFSAVEKFEFIKIDLSLTKSSLKSFIKKTSAI